MPAYESLACTVNAGLYYSPDVDLPNPTDPTWTLISDVKTGLIQCCFDFNNPSDLQAAHDGQTVYLRRPGVTGANWQTILTAAQAKVVIGIAQNGAFTWVEYSPLSGRIWVLWNYSLTLGGVWLLRSDDYGASWAAALIYTGLYNYNAGSVFSARTNGSKLYITANTGISSVLHIYHSEDGGLTFAQEVTAMGNGGAVPIAFPDWDDQNIAYSSNYVSTRYNLCRTTDGGVNYVEIDGVQNCGVALNPTGAAWINPINANVSKFTRGNNFFWSDDYWVTPNTQAGLSFDISAMDGDTAGRMLVARRNSGVAPPGDAHVVKATLDNATSFIDKSGANAGIAGGGGDSIGYDCGGVARFGLVLYYTLSFSGALGGLAMNSGRTIKKNDNTVWLRDASGFDQFVWGGPCMRVDDITKPRSGLNPAYCQDPRTGKPILKDALSTLTGLPTSTLVMKESQSDTMADALENCFFDIDRRTHCKDLDYWNGWEKIRRICAGKITERTDMGSDFDQDEAENMTTMPVTGSGDVITIRRISATFEQTATTETIAASWVAGSVCHGEKCGSRCDSEKQCVIAIVSTLVAAGSPALGINNNGGKAGYWTMIPMTEWTVDGANDVVCLGDFILVVSDGEASPFLRSYDQGVTRFALAGHADMVANPPRCLDAIDQSFIIAGAENGYIFVTADGGSTFEVADAGVATTEDINKVAICRTNPGVIYAIGQNNAIVKSENGGLSFFALTGPSAADNLVDLFIYDENHLLVANDDGEIWETDDGGENWTQQEDLPGGLTLTAGACKISFSGCGCGVVNLSFSDSTANEDVIFRNVDNGASGRWFMVDNGDTALPANHIYDDIICCGPNRSIALGGDSVAGLTGIVAVAS